MQWEVVAEKLLHLRQEHKSIYFHREIKSVKRKHCNTVYWHTKCLFSLYRKKVLYGNNLLQNFEIKNFHYYLIIGWCKNSGISGGHHHQASTSSNEAAGSLGLSRDEEARERMLVEQAKIQQHYKRLLQQRQEAEAQAASDRTNRRSDKTDSVYTGESSSNKMGPPSAVPPPRDNALPASLVAARPGSRTGITGTASDPRFANYDEIQRHLNRRQAQYHSQVS